MKGDVNIKFCVGTTRDDESGRLLVLFDFRGERVDHLKLTHDTALELAEALVEAARDAMRDRPIIVQGFPGLQK